MECSITHIRYVALGVPNVADELEFYRDAWGLVERARGDGLAFLGGVSSEDPYILRLRETEAARMDLVSFAVPTAADVDTYAAHVAACGVHVVWPAGELPTPGGGYGVRFLDLEGRTLEIASDVSTVDARPLAEREWLPGKLSHFVLNSPDLEGLIDWYCRVLGMQVSDRLMDFMAFLRADNPWHHTMALARGPWPTINHVAYETRGLDEYLRAAGRLMRAGEECVWGPGRHGPGDNTFAYFQDRVGFISEYTTALERVDDWTAWQPRVHPANPEWSDQWGTACARQAEPFNGPRDAGLFLPPPI